MTAKDAKDAKRQVSVMSKDKFTMTCRDMPSVFYEIHYAERACQTFTLRSLALFVLLRFKPVTSARQS